MKNYCIYFFWEQEKTALKYGRDYIVTEASAAPVFDDTERAGIAADHSRMVKFDSNQSSGFRVVAAALDRYCEEAPDAIRDRYATMEHELLQMRQRDAVERLRRLQPVGFAPEAARPLRVRTIEANEEEYSNGFADHSSIQQPQPEYSLTADSAPC